MTETVRPLTALDQKIFAPYFAHGKIAVAVSGGPDSMALTFLLSQYAQKRSGLEIHALTVDHGLRPESWQEAETVAQIVRHWPCVTHQILKWNGEKPESRLQEQARQARYDLMAQYCQAQNIKGLFLGHHREDQSETFLFRLAKGSGLDGLSCMYAAQDRGPVTLLRPLLSVSKAELIALCNSNALAYVQDPSNEKEHFARVRLRKSKAVLEQEGLSDKRLSITAKRLHRARNALEIYTEDAYKKYLKNKNTKHIELYINLLNDPEEIVLRVLKKAISKLSPTAPPYPVREEKLEALIQDLISGAPFRKRTLGGLIFEKDEGEGLIRLTQEKGTS